MRGVSVLEVLLVFLFFRVGLALSYSSFLADLAKWENAVLGWSYLGGFLTFLSPTFPSADVSICA